MIEIDVAPSEDTTVAQSKTIVSFVLDDPDSYAYGAEQADEAAHKTENKESRKRAR